MAKYELILPKMGESIMEATILKWLKKEGDPIEADETILEVATDKVDSEVPSPVKGILKQILFKENDVVAIGKAIAYIETESAGSSATVINKPTPVVTQTEAPQAKPQQSATLSVSTKTISDNRFYSPLVRSIAKEEGIGMDQLSSIEGSGKDGRLTKRDMLAYLSGSTIKEIPDSGTIMPASKPTISPSPAQSVSGATEIIEMDRMRKLIADHMVMSKQTSPHVSSFIEIDVTPIVMWRNKVKKSFEAKYGQKITFTPIFIEAIARAIKDFPMVNVSVNGNQIIRKLDINIGMAAALPSGNLIVPVIRNADRLNLAGLSYAVNDLAGRARENKLKPDEIQDGTFTLTNVGTFGNIMGTPIINQPQVAILATGVIKKKPAVIEMPTGDFIGIRHMMYLSLSYDHRVVDGALGGSFLKRVGDYLEEFDINQSI